jgi:hypothetical protein
MATIRRFALSLPETTEAPHHDFSSFRVRGRIFVTIPPGDDVIHVFVGEEDRERTLAMYPDWAEKLMWGARAPGVRVTLAPAPAAIVKSLVRTAYDTRLAKR